MRYSLRTLVILLAILPPILAWYGWPPLKAWLSSKRPSLTTPVVVVPVKKPPPQSSPQLQFLVYRLGNADPTAVEYAARTKLPQVKMQFDSKIGKLAVLRTASDHRIVRETIRDIQKPPADSD